MSGTIAYCITTSSVLAECHQIRRSLSECPYFVIEMMSPQLTRKFADMIANYKSNYCYIRNLFWNTESRSSLCSAMFRSVLTPHVYRYNDKIVFDYVTMGLVIQALDSVPELRTLHFPLRGVVVDPAALARMIYHLRHLQIFTYGGHCTDEVIEQLGLHCIHLQKVSVCHSSRVTNASAKHLLRLGKFEWKRN
jgi:hypothetical protein